MDPILAPQAPVPAVELVADGWFEREVQPHSGALKSYLTSRYPSLPDIDNLVQEALVRMLRMQRNALLRSPKAMLFTIGRNLACDALRRNQVIKFEPIAEMDDSFVFNPDGGAAETISHEEELAILKEAVQALPGRCRQVMTMRIACSLPQKDIAARLGISESAVEKQLAKGIRRCADFFARRGIFNL